MNAPSLREAINARFGDDLDTPCVYKSIRPISTPRQLKKLLQRYVDEDTKSDPVVAPEGPVENYSKLVVEGLAPQRPGVDFVAGQKGLKVYGFLGRILREYSDDPSRWTTEEIVARLYPWWAAQREKNIRKGYHSIYSINPRYSAALGELGIPVDDVLQYCVAESLTTYGHRYYPRSSLGWVTGVHHDRHHAHAHVIVYPTTSDGDNLVYSDRAIVRHEGATIRVDFRHTLVDAYRTSVERTLAYVGAPKLTRLPVALEGYIEASAGIQCAEQILATHPGRRNSEVVTAWAEFLDSDAASSELNRVLPRLGDLSSGAVPAKGLQVFRDRLAGYRSQNTAILAQIAGQKATVARAFSKVREHPDAYRPVRYAPGTRGVSPSGTLSCIGLNRGRHGFVEPTLNEIRDMIGKKLARFDGVMAEQQTLLPSIHNPPIPETFVRDQFARAGLGLMVARGVIGAITSTLGLPPVTANPAKLEQATLLSVPAARRNVLGRLASAARLIGHEQRTATGEELKMLHRRNVIHKAFGAEGPDAEEVTLKLLTTAAMIPSTPNFLEREAMRAGLRSMSTMKEESATMLKRLMDVINFSTQNRYPSASL